MSGPLSGLKVVDLSQFILGPIATQILGDLGADVIKIESPNSDMKRDIGPQRHPKMAALFLGMDRNKRSVVLDLKQPAALATLLRLVDGVDVPFPTKDGYICLMATSDVQWQRLLAALDRPEVAQDERFATLARRSSHFPQLYAIVADELKKRSTAEWQARLDKADISNGPARMLSELPSDPYLVATKFFHHYAHPQAGPLVTTSIPVQFSRTPGSVRRPPPVLGEHTSEVLAELGDDGNKAAAVAAAETV
jgi:crotonobetainyl-CoA:carnitine CoA-transferase CaiB-like acyl-CoA transferase